jgi:AcrR family transcriptional regulator
VTATSADLTAQARIRNSGLALFADRGVAATSIRDIAQHAGVSPGLIQHHFGTKDGLRDAINEHVLALATESFAELPEPGDPAELQHRLGDRIADFVRDNPTALRYVARAIADRDDAALRLFDAFVAITRRQWDQLAGYGLLRPDADLEWASLHVVVLNLGTILFLEAIQRHLPTEFSEASQLARWNRASSDLFQRGVYRPSAS